MSSFILKLLLMQVIKKTCPCSEYPLKPHFYIEKLGYAGIYLFEPASICACIRSHFERVGKRTESKFQNIDRGYMLELPR